MTWCEEIGLKVLIDLHGAPGSQNGFDNSGRRGDVNWFQPGNLTNIDRTLDILDKFAGLMVNWIYDGTISETTLEGIEIVNEPLGWRPELWQEISTGFYLVSNKLVSSACHRT